MDDGTADSTSAGRLTRGQVAKALGISIAAVRRREGKTLHPVRGSKGECLFDPAEVAALRGLQEGRARDTETPAIGAIGEAPCPVTVPEVPVETAAEEVPEPVVVDANPVPCEVPRAPTSLTAPPGDSTERRLFSVERRLEVYKDCSDIILDELRSLRRRVSGLERNAGIDPGG